MRINPKKLKIITLRVGNHAAVRTILLSSALGLMLIGGVILGYYEGRYDRNNFDDQSEQLTQLKSQKEAVTQSLKVIGSAHEAEWNAHNDALASALLILDAYKAGGLKKAGLLYDAAIDGVDNAEIFKDQIKDELEKYGVFAPTDQTAPAI